MLFAPDFASFPVMILDKLTFQPGCCNLYHINLRTDIRKHPLYMSKSSASIVSPWGMVILFSFMTSVRSEGLLPRQYFPYLPFHTLPSNLECPYKAGLDLALREISPSASTASWIMPISLRATPSTALAICSPVAFCKSSHHTHVDPDNLTIPDSYNFPGADPHEKSRRP